MKTLFVVLGLAFFAALPASAQNTRVDGIALTRGGAPAPGANVAILSPQPANTTTAPGSPLAALCLNLTDTLCGQPNPVQADGLGNYHFYIATGTTYTRQIYGSGLSTLVSPDQLAGGGGTGGVTCPAGSVALPYFNGTLIVCDSNANFDGNATWTFENINSPGTITGGTLATTGPGGILDLQFQTPPTSVPVGHAYVFANSNTNLFDCLKNGLVACFSGIQLIAQGTAAMSTSAVSAGGCNTTTVSAPGVTTSSRVFANTTVDSTGVTGYGPSTSGGLWIPSGWATTNNVNFKVCNDTANPITGGALSLTWVAF
jgi:hypothetical protein